MVQKTSVRYRPCRFILSIITFEGVSNMRVTDMSARFNNSTRLAVTEAAVNGGDVSLVVISPRSQLGLVPHGLIVVTVRLQSHGVDECCWWIRLWRDDNGASGRWWNCHVLIRNHREPPVPPQFSSPALCRVPRPIDQRSQWKTGLPA